jgi:hypothetical protein
MLDSDTTFHCTRCNRGFKRIDLLQRHESRNICSETTKGQGDALHYQNLSNPSAETDRRATIGEESSSKRQKTAITHTSSSIFTIQPKTDHHSSSLSTHPMSAPAIYGAGPDIEVAKQSEWDTDFFTPAAWDALPVLQMATPLSKPAYDFDFSGWTMPMNRMQESAERGMSENMVSPGLVLRLNREYSDFELDLPYLVQTLDSYWSNVAASFPFVHRGTFVVNDAPSELVIMMVITGSVHLPSPRVDYRKTVQKIRGVLTQSCGLDMPITTLQAYTLCHVYDTWYGTSESLFVAQCMWPVMVAHSRRKGIGVIDRPDSNVVQHEEAWSIWAKDEERRRAAFCVLLLDTQISAFWNQHPSRQLPIFCHNIALPCSKAQWDALSAIDWLCVREPAPAPPSVDVPKKRSSPFLPGLHPDFAVQNVSEGYSSNLLCALVAEQKLKFGLDVDHKFGAEMVLIGHMAVAWDCRTRGGMGMKMSGDKSWREIVLNGELIT